MILTAIPSKLEHFGIRALQNYAGPISHLVAKLMTWGWSFYLNSIKTHNNLLNNHKKVSNHTLTCKKTLNILKLLQFYITASLKEITWWNWYNKRKTHCKKWTTFWHAKSMETIEIIRNCKFQILYNEIDIVKDKHRDYIQVFPQCISSISFCVCVGGCICKYLKTRMCACK